MGFNEWFEKDGINHERCIGLTQDEKDIAERAWQACKNQCTSIAKSYVGDKDESDYSEEQCYLLIEELIASIEDKV